MKKPKRKPAYADLADLDEDKRAAQGGVPSRHISEIT